MRAYKALRLRLTAVCAVSTGLVLAAMAGLSYRFTVEQLEWQYEQSFLGGVSAVVQYIRDQPAITHTWLMQTELDAGLHIGIKSRQGYTIYTKYAGSDTARDRLTALAYETAGRADDPAAQDVMALELEGKRYRACVAQVQAGDRLLQVAVVGDRQEEMAQITSVGLRFAASAVGATVCLLGFAWFFSAWVTRPVEESQKRQTAFVGAASHEFRSPVAVILMAAENLQKAPPELKERFVGMILRECRRLSRLTEDMLQLAGADSQNLTVQMEPVNPEAAVLSAYEKFQPIAAGKQIRLQLDLAHSPLPKVSCDRDRVEQILDVLLDNAVRYTPKEGSIVIGAHAGRGNVFFTVADSGPGIADDQKEMIFQRFYQQDASRTGKEHFGLGLSVARELATLQKGTLHAQDNPDGGSLFVLKLPVHIGKER